MVATSGDQAQARRGRYSYHCEEKDLFGDSTMIGKVGCLEGQLVGEVSWLERSVSRFCLT